MESKNLTREELAQYILKTAKNSVLNKINKLVSNMQKSDIIAHTILGEPLNEMQYKAEIKKGLRDINLVG